MPPMHAVAINAGTSLEGDVNTLLLALEHLDPGAFRVTVVSIPRGAVYERLRRRPDTRVVSMELGGKEGRAVGRGRRLAETASAIARIAALVIGQRADVLVSLDRTVSAYVATAVAALTRRPFVLSAHYPLYPRGGLLNRVVLRRARRVVVHSAFLASHLQAFVADAKRLVVVPNGIELQRYVPDRGALEMRRRFGIDASSPVVVMAGRLSRFKGQDDLVEAAAVIAARRPDVRFLIAGHDTDEVAPGTTGGFQQRLERLIADRGVGERLRLVGYVDDLPAFIGAGDILAMPSWEEPFGLVALEAMAMARPVVATRAGGVPEFVVDGDNGLLVPPRDAQSLARALLALVSDPERARAMGRNGRHRVESAHTAESYAAKFGDALLAAARRTRSA